MQVVSNILPAGMGACRRSPARKQHLGLPGGAAGAMDKHQHINRHGKQTRAYLRTRVRVDIFKVDSWESPEINA